MIIVNQAGLSETERASVCKPLAQNDVSDLDIEGLEDSLNEVMNLFGDVIEDAVQNIDRAALHK